MTEHLTPSPGLATTPRLDPDSWVAPGAHVLGDVTLGAGSSVWYTAVIRADQEKIVIGAETNIQDGCVLHADPGFPLTLGDRVSVGHRAVLHGCTIHSDVLVGMGAIVLNGAVLHSGCLVAAGAMDPEGLEAPPGSLLAGVPATVKRQLTDDEIERMVRPNARQYAMLRNALVHRGDSTQKPTTPTTENPAPEEKS